MKRWHRAMVTGAASGIGLALCEKLILQGVEVIAIDVNNVKLQKNFDSNLLKYIDINLVNSKSVNKLIEQLKNIGKCDLIIHNAGISATGKFEEIDPKAYENLIRLNAGFPMQASIAMARENCYADNTNLIFISSLSHATGYPGASVYGASKDAIAIFAKSIRKPFAKRGIAVTTIFPGPVRTAHAERHAPKGASAEKRMMPEEVAIRILNAASRNAKTLHPGGVAKITGFLGKIAPNFMTKLMRKIIYDKLDRAVW
ncbi:SDR family oxidoreductase [Lentilitoribacter sp. Alg239-R112]|uniref:SDR family NAD(P)-dependent oxidoreductase n=1 Tax=Lentilitoribacter sp. Alg239-R112 TaxID=2305987 RepID=UPI0013A6AB58|nr:SDR family oxidoreductase [Lentilitoribacter sp. Alg239-R112]